MKIAVIVENGSALDELQNFLRDRGEVDTYSSEAEFLQRGEPESAHCVIAEASAARRLHLQLLEAGGTTPVIYLAEEPSIAEAVEAIKLGAVDYLGRPLAAAELERALEAALRQKRTGVPERFFAPGVGLEAQLDAMERELISSALMRTSGVVGGRSGAAKLLGVTRTGLLYKMRRLSISRALIASAEAEVMAEVESSRAASQAS